MPRNEEEQFLNEFEDSQQEYTGVDDVVVPQEQQRQEEEVTPAPVKNRAHRRLEKALEESRQMNRELQEFIRNQKQQPSETQRFNQEVQLDQDVHQMLFGATPETPETRASALAVQRVLERQAKTAEERAYQRAFETIQNSQQANQKEVEENKEYLESELESIEDSFNIDLSGDTDASRKLRNGFLDYVEKLSRKDREGNILDYPDIQGAWEEFNSRRERAANTRNRQVASRSMATSAGTEALSDSQAKALEKYMLENGFI